MQVTRYATGVLVATSEERRMGDLRLTHGLRLKLPAPDRKQVCR